MTLVFVQTVILLLKELEERTVNYMKKQSCQQSVKIVNFGVKKELKSVIERFLLTIKL